MYTVKRADRDMHTLTSTVYVMCLYGVLIIDYAVMLCDNYMDGKLK